MYILEIVGNFGSEYHDASALLKDGKIVVTAEQRDLAEENMHGGKHDTM